MKSLLLAILTLNATLTFGQRVFRGQEDIIEPEPKIRGCQGSVSGMTFPQVEIKGDTVISWYPYGTIYYVNDSTEIYGRQGWGSPSFEFKCDSTSGCQFWVLDYDGNMLRSKPLLLQTPFSDPIYVLDGVRLGYYDRQIRMLLEKEHTNANTH